MTLIGVELNKRHDAPRKRADFPIRSFLTRPCGKPTQEAEQMTAPCVLVRLPPFRRYVGSTPVSSSSLPLHQVVSASREGRSKGLSGMMRKHHVSI